MGGYHENICDSFFHRDCDDVALVLFFDNLIESLYVHAVELSFNHRDCHWWSDMHGLLLAKTYMTVFCRVFTADTNCIVLGVVLETFHFKRACECSIFSLYKLV